MPIDISNPGFEYFMKTCTFEQLSILRAACSGLKDMGVFFLPISAFYEDSTETAITEEEKGVLFEAVKNEENKASVYNLEELCEHIEKELIHEQEGLKIEAKSTDLDLDNVSLGFHSESEGEDFDPNEDEEHDGKFIDQSKEGKDLRVSEKGNEKSFGESKIEFFSEDADIKSLRMFEDTKDYLLEAAEKLSEGIKRVNFLKDQKQHIPKNVDSASDMLSEAGQGIGKASILIDKIKNQRRNITLLMEQTRHRINALELDLRTQGDFAGNLRFENEELCKRKKLTKYLIVRKIDLFESKDQLIQELTNQIKENEYKFMDERQELNAKILKLEREIETEKVKYEEIESRFSHVKKDMNLIEKINEKQHQELEQETVKVEIVEDLREKILDLSTKFEKVSIELMKEKDKTLDLKLELREKELELRREEVRADELTKEIEFLELKNQEWEEKYDNDKIQGNAHIGLSRIDFMAVNALDKNNSQRNSFGKSYLYASVYNGGGGVTGGKKKSNPSIAESVKNGSIVINEMDNFEITEASRHLESSEHTQLQTSSNIQVSVPPTPRFENSEKKGGSEDVRNMDVDSTGNFRYQGKGKKKGNGGARSMNVGSTGNFRYQGEMKKKGAESKNLKKGEEKIWKNSASKKKDMEFDSEDDDDKPIPIFGSVIKSKNPSFGAGFNIAGFESQIVLPESEKGGNNRIERNLDNIVPDSLAESALVTNDLTTHNIFNRHRGVGASEKHSNTNSIRLKSEPRKTFDLMDRFSARSSRKSNLGMLQFDFNRLSLAMKNLSSISELSLKKDYLNLSNNILLEETLTRFGDKDIGGKCFSDHIYVFGNKMKRKRMKILVSTNGIYLFTSKRNNKIKLERRYPLKNLTQVTITSKNYTLTLFSFTSGYDLLVDSYRRLDIILYIAQVVKKAGHELFKLTYLQSFKLKKRDREEVKIDYKKNFKSQLPILQETFRNTARCGYLKIRKRRLFGHHFPEYFFILSNVGIVYFKNYGTGRSSGFLPFLGARVREGDYNEYKKHFVMIIEYSSKLRIVLQALSDLDRDEWIEGIRHYQRNAITSEENYKKMEKSLKKKKKRNKY